MKIKQFWIHTCSIDGAFLTSFQRPLDQFHSIIHVVCSTYSITCWPSRLLQQPQDVWGICCIPPHPVNAPVLCGEAVSASDGIVYILNIFYIFILCRLFFYHHWTYATCQQICTLTLFWSTHKLSQQLLWLQPQLFQWHFCSNLILLAKKKKSQLICSLLSLTQSSHLSLWFCYFSICLSIDWFLKIDYWSWLCFLVYNAVNKLNK